MKAFTARSEAILRRTVVLYPTFQLFLVPILLIGFAGVLFPFDPPLEQADQVLPALLMQIDLPALVVGLFCAGALAASMSSGDAILHSCASILVRDGWVTGLDRRLSPHAERGAIRALLVVVAVASYVVALTYGEDLVGILAYAYGPITQLAPVVVAALYWRRATGSGALAGLLAGIGVTFVVHAQRTAWGVTVHPGALGLAANVVVLVVVSLLTRERDPLARDAFLDAAAERSA
jgi:SSS family solute:Na+ symporter